jgi:hypothetical protein
MGITRTGSTPSYLEYVIRQVLIPRSASPTPEFVRVTEFGGFRWIDIPSYQRGLVWDDVKFEELLESTSVFLGNAILGCFRIPEDRAGFEKVPQSVPEYEILIDGLQRFSIGTALLNILFPLVLTDHPSKAVEAPLFTALKQHCMPYSAVFQHNDTELEKHSRRAVRDSYSEFRATLARWVDLEFKGANVEGFAKNVQRLFLSRQIAPDSYYGFVSPYEVSNTFIGLNTIRVELSIVDWLRSLIVEKGDRSKWSGTIVETVENRFTEVFIRGTDPQRELMPFAAIVKDCIENDTQAAKVFPSWNTGLAVQEVLDFLEFVSRMFEHRKNEYFNELRQCGAIPFAGCLCYYYKLFLASKQDPSFLTDGTDENGELRAYLRANYRALFDGRIGRTRAHAEELLVDGITLMEISDEISDQFTKRKLNERVDPGWLVASLKETDKRRAPRIFNACLLPQDGTTEFKPHHYGNKGASNYQIDHLIPESALVENSPGWPEGHLLMNFGPIRRTANNKQSNLMCSEKLSEGRSYHVEMHNDENVHPYVEWLVTHQAQYQSQLDRQELLQPNSEPPLADERIEWLAKRIGERL